VVQPPPSSPPSPPERASPPAALQPEKEKKKLEGLLAATPSPKEEEKEKERGHILKVIAIEKTWLRIKPNDQPVIEVLLQPKETASWSARRRFDITVGNAGGIEIFFNGVFQGRLGKSGEVIHLVLPKETREIIPPQKVPAKEPAPSKDTKPVETKPSPGPPSKENKPSDEGSEAKKNS